MISSLRPATTLPRRAEPLSYKGSCFEFLRSKYLALGCACALTLDGADEDDKAGRQDLLDAFEVFLTAATAEGPVHVLVADGSRTPPKQVTVSVAEFHDVDFDSARDVPSLLAVRSG